MQKIYLQTTQNVAIEYDLASIWDRIVANILDYLILAGYIISALLIFTWLKTGMAFFFIFMIPVIFYQLLCEVLMEGQSFGMRQRKIKVVRLDGMQPDLGNYFLRWILRPVDLFFYGGIAIMAIIISGKGQRLGDMAAGTSVVKLKNKAAFHDTIFRATEEEYNPVFPEVVRLSDNNIHVVQEAIVFYKNNRNMDPARQLEEKIKILLNIRSDMDTMDFLHTVIRDYNHLTGKAVS